MADVPVTPPPIVRTPAEARDFAEALRLVVDPHASVAMRERAATRMRELLRRLNAAGLENGR